MEDDKWVGRELRAGDMENIGKLLERAPLGESVMVRAAYERAQKEDFKGWWYGGLRNGTELEAVMAIDNHKAQIYAHSDEAARGMGYELFQQQKRMGPGLQTHRHQLVGELKTISNIWHYVKDLPTRKAISDRTCAMLEATGRADKCPSSRVEFAVAVESDLRVVFDMTAEALTEQIQVDPRKVGRDAHWARCENLVRRGLQLIARDDGRPFFVAELAKQTRNVIMLDKIYVPTQFRSRSRLIAGAMWHAAGLTERLGGRRLFALATDPSVGDAGIQAGWSTLSTYRWAIALG